MSANQSLLGNSPVMVFFVTAFWWVAMCIIDFKERTVKYKTLVFGLILCSGLFAFMMTLRSYMIQSCLLIIVALSQVGRSKLSKFTTYITVFAGIYFLLDYIGVSAAWSDSIDALIQKNEMDTRSFQYEEIFSQTDLSTWLLGGGINASYMSATHGGGAYTSIDNQYIFTLFHYGIFLTFPYFYIWFSSVYQLFKKRIPITEKSYMFVAIFWLFALGGLSVFNVIVINPQNIILAIVLGHCIYKKHIAILSRQS